MKNSSRLILIVILIALLPAIVSLQKAIDPQRAQFQPGRGLKSVMTNVGNNPVVLPTQFIAGTAIGFREVVAGLLWVRCDEFFHNGNYEAIIPLIRMITWLDPHQIDVYNVGAWHLAYNFVDSAQRADRRYLPPAIKLLEEGVENNPGIYECKFDLGFVLYQLKAKNFEKTIYWTTMASKDKNAPSFIPRSIAHAYEKAGKIDEAIAQWNKCIKDAEAGFAKNPKDFGMRNHLDVSIRNRDAMIVRKALRADLSKNPLDAKFEAQFKKLSPRVLRVSGKTNLPDGSRIDVYLLDKDFKEPVLKSFTWAVDPTVTALVENGSHGIVVTKGKFERKYDLTADVKQYPFKKDSYSLIFTFNPRTASIGVQDKTGWSGEGITDQKYLDTSVKGIRMIKKVIPLKREDIL